MPDGVLAGDADAPQRDPGEVVDGAVERVDDPAQAGRPVAVGGALLAEDPVIGAAAGEHGGDRGLGGPVGVRDEVGRALLGAEPARRAAVAVVQLGARAERRLPGDVEDVAGHDGRALRVAFCLHTHGLHHGCAPVLPDIHRLVTVHAVGARHAAGAGSVAVRNGRIPRAW